MPEHEVAVHTATWLTDPTLPEGVVEMRLDDGTVIDWFIVNAGPSS